MKILVTGAKGMVGTALVDRLSTIQDGRDHTRPELCVEEIYAYDVDSSHEELEAFCARADFVFHLAGVNRPENTADFITGNVDLTRELLRLLEQNGGHADVMLSSSVQATLAGRFGDSAYGRSKQMSEQLVFDYAKRTGARAAVYRFPNLMGHSRPNYNSAVSTFCWAVANDQPFTVHDRSVELELLYIEDLLEGMLDLLQGKEQHCTFDGVDAVPCELGAYCWIPLTYRVTLGEIVDLLEQFRGQSETLMMPKMPKGSFANKLFSLYLTYVPTERFRLPLNMHEDARGSFTELIHTEDCGQVSVNISRPGVLKGQHWHLNKWELFIVVSGHGLIRERNLQSGETVEFEVSGKRIEAIRMIPGWTHSILNLSDTEDLVTVMTSNENFDPTHPDTYFEPV